MISGKEVEKLRVYYKRYEYLLYAIITRISGSMMSSKYKKQKQQKYKTLSIS